MEDVKNFYEEYEDMFEDYLEICKGNLKNKEYKKLEQKCNKILKENENLNYILEGKIENRKLTNDECKSLYELTKIYYDMHQFEEKEIFFLGGKEIYFFLKKMEILK